MTTSSAFAIEPFILADWVNHWQRPFTEKGISGFNLVMEGLYTSLLRSEVGVRFYERWDFSTGTLSLEQKVSYVNQTPFHFGTVTTFFVESVSLFPVAIGSSKGQNLGGVEWRLSFSPRHPHFPYLIFDLQGELGSSYQSYFVGLELGKDF